MLDHGGLLTFLAAGREHLLVEDGVRGGGPDSVVDVRSPGDETYVVALLREHPAAAAGATLRTLLRRAAAAEALGVRASVLEEALDRGALAGLPSVCRTANSLGPARPIPGGPNASRPAVLAVGDRGV